MLARATRIDEELEYKKAVIATEMTKDNNMNYSTTATDVASRDVKHADDRQSEPFPVESQNSSHKIAQDKLVKK